MSPPTYADLGKSARDVFGKGYHFGSIQLDCKTTTESGVEISTGGAHALESGKVNGNLETKYKCKEYGVTITEKWNTDNVLNTDLTLEDKIAKGLKLNLCSSFSPVTGKKKGTLKATYKSDVITVNADSGLVMSPVLNAAAVASYKNWLLGTQIAFDTSKSKLTKNNFAAGFTCKDFAVHTFANDGSEFGGSLHHKLSKDLEAAVDMGWSASANTTRFGLGCKYALDGNTSVRAKVNNLALIGLGFQHKLRDGVTITLSTLLDGKNINAGGNKLGLALDLSA